MKTGKPLWRVSITTTLEAEDAVAAMLNATLGLNASSHFNVETGVSVVSVFGSRKIISKRGVREALAANLKRIKSFGLKTGAAKIQTAKVRRENWAESWKRHFKAVEIGRTLLIKPSWIKRQPRKNQAVVVLDPGLSFGTGQHATTSYCLQEIVRCRNSGVRQSFLDVGTGSGILAIAAVKLGYQPVRAFDFDPEAVRVARVNAGVNRVRGKLLIAKGDITRMPLRSTKKYNLVCANLISNLLIAERRRIVAQLNHGGTLVLAGILNSEFILVQRAFEDLGLNLVASQGEKEWRSGSFQYPAK